MKLLEKYKNVSAPVKASFWFLLCSFLQKGIAMLTTPIFTRIMSEEAYGQFTVYNSWYNIFFALVSLNFAAGVFTRGLVRNDTDQDAYSSSLVGLSTACITVGFIIYLLFSNSINTFTGLSTFLMVLMFVEIWSCTVYQFWSNKERVNYKYIRLVVVTLIYVIARPILSIIFILTFDSEYQVEARVLATSIVCLILFSILFFEIVIKGKKLFNKEYWISALKFNLPLLPHYLSQIILNQSDKIMIDKMCGKTETAYYSVAYSIAMVLLVVNTSITGTLNPWIYKNIKSGKYQRIGKVSYIILALIAFCNAALIAVAPELLMLMAPDTYYEAVWLIPPLTISVYFIFLYSLFATFEYYFGKTNYVAFASVSGAVLNLVLNYFAIKTFGYIAAGYTTLICNIVFVMLHYLFMRKVNKEYMSDFKVYNIRIILLIGLALIAASAVMMYLFDYWYIRYAIIFASAILLFVFRKKLICMIKKEFEK
ncbi:MAG: lipopolysaccharide biosynthesis protein [Eubacteriales bacterium]